jgi:hypothetical protein
MTVWRKAKGWLYETFERDVDPEALPGCEDLVRLWQEKRGDRLVPAWADFNFHDFKGWHGRISLANVMYDPFDIHYKLVGLQMAARLRVDYTGKRYSEMAADGLDAVDDFEFYEMTSHKMLISRLSGDLLWNGLQPITATFVEFPLSDTGEKSTHLLSALL